MFYEERLAAAQLTDKCRHITADPQLTDKCQHITADPQLTHKRQHITANSVMASVASSPAYAKKCFDLIVTEPGTPHHPPTQKKEKKLYLTQEGAVFPLSYSVQHSQKAFQSDRHHN